MKEKEKTKRRTKTASRKKNYFQWFSSSGRVKAKVRARVKAKESAGTVAMVIIAAEIARTTSKTVGQKQCRGKANKTHESAKVQAKDGTQEKATGTVSKGKGKEWQPYGKWS